MADIYRSEQDLIDDEFMETIAAATKAGFTDQMTDDNGHVLCQKPDTMELVDIFPNGGWEYQNARENEPMQEMSGANAALLALYLASDENKKLFEEGRDSEDGLSSES